MFWYGSWGQWYSGDHKGKPWNVLYQSHKYAPKVNVERDIDSLISELTTCLIEISQFALRFGYDGFAGCFEKAFSCLQGDNDNTYDTDFAPKYGISIQARNLLLACQHAWVFGGMGAWNDVAYSNDDRTSVRLTESLYKLLCDSIVCAANQSGIHSQG